MQQFDLIIIGGGIIGVEFASIFSGFGYQVTVLEAKKQILRAEDRKAKIEIIDCDHDLGDNAHDGGDGIKLLDWLAERQTFYPVALHTMNPVGRENMQRGIERDWR